MDLSNLTSTSSAAYKARPVPSASVVTTDVSQKANTAVSAPVEPTVTQASREQPSLNQPAEVVQEEVAQSPELLQDTLRKLNDLAQTSIAFSQHEETGRTVITVSDKNTGEEIRTIPSEDFLALSAHLEEVLDSAEGLKPGLLVSSQA